MLQLFVCRINELRACFKFSPKPVQSFTAFFLLNVYTKEISTRLGPQIRCKHFPQNSILPIFLASFSRHKRFFLFLGCRRTASIAAHSTVSKRCWCTSHSTLAAPRASGPAGSNRLINIFPLTSSRSARKRRKRNQVSGWARAGQS
jgi:hypothetical protein